MKKIILFDGQCHFCNGSVQFIIKRDPKAIFSFASLQSEIGQSLLNEYNVPAHENSLILISNNHFYSKSTAALKISKELRFLWKLCYFFIIIPVPIRDFIYNIIAKNRYKLINKTVCEIPSPEDKKRFL
ncbi:DCC1-like thiol-disulfide oxidoreductase family protein [Pseudogracilibacillus sp. SE30717A]|uniref:thiol-disulfide oxidoreductase DCC family protein n=1 Tax=Pseudogracilibacillus sp. SE30717A TaxID=3098293 RepID=UPI00300DDC4A